MRTVLITVTFRNLLEVDLPHCSYLFILNEGHFINEHIGLALSLQKCPLWLRGRRFSSSNCLFSEVKLESLLVYSDWQPCFEYVVRRLF